MLNNIFIANYLTFSIEAKLLKLKYPIFKMAARKIMGLEFT